MGPNMEPARAQAAAALRQQLAARVAIGANLAGLPPDRRPTALRQLAALMLAEGEEPFSEAEACLMARIAERRPDLQDPAAVDLSDPATQQVARQLAEVWRCIDARAQARAQLPR
jgi:inorganic triphosphatase YgiF